MVQRVSERALRVKFLGKNGGISGAIVLRISMHFSALVVLGLR